MTAFAQKSIDQEWSFADCKPSDTAKWTHAYHRYPAKFIPQLVEKLFDEYLHGPTASVNDPFMGSGTTVVSAVSRGYYASGTDINRIAFLIAAAKARPVDPQHLEKKLGDFFAQLAFLGQESKNCASAHSDIEPLVPAKHLERIRYWFSEGNIVKLGQIYRIMSQEEDDTIKNYLLVFS
ncbi:MAG: site-specific DNA-methyltransferase, partial [Chloroflexi bacterium]|nr:site-specific DNA-methyltransferase [Chloroflexota bacterium]